VDALEKRKGECVNREEAEAKCEWWSCKQQDTIPRQSPDEAIEAGIDDTYPDPLTGTITLRGYSAVDPPDPNWEGEDENDVQIEQVYTEEINVPEWVAANRPEWLEDEKEGQAP
jgi:hypothetical protein